MKARAPEAIRQCLRQATPRHEYRSFTSSCKRHRNGRGSIIDPSNLCSYSTGYLTVFPPTSSPELDSLISTFRQRLFVYSHLPEQNRRLVRRPTNHHYLTGEEPVTTKIAVMNPFTEEKIRRETFRLEPLKHLSSEDAQESFRHLVALLKEKGDWNILAHFLREYQLTGRKLNRTMIQKMIRQASRSDNFGVIIELFRKNNMTGLSLKDRHVAMEVMLGCFERAVSKDWEEHQLNRALKNSESAMAMMCQPHHAPAERNLRPDNQPEVIGVPLALAAARAMKYRDGKDEDGKVKTYAKRFLSTFNGQQFAEDAENATGIPGKANYFIARWSPSWGGLNLASKLLAKDSEVSDSINDIESAILGPQIKRAFENVKNQDTEAEERRGLRIFNGISSVL